MPNPQTAETSSRVTFAQPAAPPFSVNSGFHGLVFVRASSLDDLEVFKPTMVVYTRSAASWDHMDPSLPAYPEMAPQNDRPPEVMSAQQG